MEFDLQPIKSKLGDGSWSKESYHTSSIMQGERGRASHDKPPEFVCFG